MPLGQNALQTMDSISFDIDENPHHNQFDSFLLSRLPLEIVLMIFSFVSKCSIRGVCPASQTCRFLFRLLRPKILEYTYHRARYIFFVACRRNFPRTIERMLVLFSRHDRAAIRGQGAMHDHNTHTPLQVAAASGSVKVLEILLESRRDLPYLWQLNLGRDRTSRELTGDPFLNIDRPLDLAVTFNRHDAIRFLVRKSAVIRPTCQLMTRLSYCGVNTFAMIVCSRRACPTLLHPSWLSKTVKNIFWSHFNCMRFLHFFNDSPCACMNKISILRHHIQNLCLLWDMLFETRTEGTAFSKSIDRHIRHIEGLLFNVELDRLPGKDYWHYLANDED